MDWEKIKQAMIIPLIFFSFFYVTWVLQTGSFKVSLSVINNVKPPVEVAAKPETKVAPRQQTEGGAEETSPVGAHPVPSPVEAAQEPASFKEPPPVPAFASWGRDPFFISPKEMVAPVRERPRSNLRITSIITNGPNRVATIGDSIVKEGEMVGVEKVVEIRENGVLLSRGGEKRFLEFPGSSVSIEVKRP